jgi:hypothetical protein
LTSRIAQSSGSSTSRSAASTVPPAPPRCSPPPPPCGDAALTAWTFRLSWTQDGRHQARRLRIAHVWVKESGRWRIAYTQLTRIPDQGD